MFVLTIQTILLLAIAFILGCIIGCLLRRFFGAAEETAPVAKTGAVAGTTAAAAAAVAATPPVKKPEPTAPPLVPKPPMPSAPKVKPVAASKGSASIPKTAKPASEKEAEPKATPVAPLVSKPVAKERAKAAPKPPIAKPVGAERDNLKLIKGIGPQNEGRLNALNVYRFEQIASWTAKDEADIGEALAFPGRIEREEWVSQAKVLAKGGSTEFAGRVKSGEVGSSLGTADAGNMGTKPETLLAARGGTPDNLTLIDGVGNAIEQKMFKLGIFHFDQIAEMTADELVWLGGAVGFPGRPERENWVGESKILAAGGTTDHAKRVERGEIKTSRKTDD